MQTLGTKQKIKIRNGSHFLDKKYIGLEGYITKLYCDFAGVNSNCEILKGYKVKLKGYRKEMMFYEDELEIL